MAGVARVLIRGGAVGVFLIRIWNICFGERILEIRNPLIGDVPTTDVPAEAEVNPGQPPAIVRDGDDSLIGDLLAGAKVNPGQPPAIVRDGDDGLIGDGMAVAEAQALRSTSFRLRQ